MVSFEQAAAHFALRPGITAIIGGGGKTTLMLYLAKQLCRYGSVLVTTSTHIRKPDSLSYAEQIENPLADHTCMVVGTPDKDGKLKAPQQTFDELQGYCQYLLVEADGAKQLPLKAHASHEPVIPAKAQTVLAVIGLDAIGKPIRDVVHRPEQFCQAVHVTQEDIVTPERIVAIVETYPRVTGVILNKADTEQRLYAAKELAALLPYPVAITALQQQKWIELWRNGTCWLS